MTDTVTASGLPAGSEEVRVRATQSIVSWMSFCWRHPLLTAIEVGWRWLFGVPFLAVVWIQVQGILAAIPPSSAGLDKLSFQNPWTTSVLLADAAGTYRPAVGEVLRWLVPVGIVGWAIVSGLGRTLVMWRMLRADSEDVRTGNLLRRVPAVMVLQGLWMAALVGFFWVWYALVGWAARTYLTSVTEPDLVGYLSWVIFLSLGLYVVWAVTSWTLSSAPLLVMLEGRSFAGALRRSFALGKTLSAKLVEVNLVLSIVRITLMVLAMVFCAAPLPFSDQFGQDFMHLLYVVIGVVFLIANDYFAVVRLRSFVGLWRVYREDEERKNLKLASTRLIRRYASIQRDFFERIFDNEYEDIWVSDESSLHDFATTRSLEPYYAKIRDVYGVEVADIEGALLWKILQRIEKKS